MKSKYNAALLVLVIRLFFAASANAQTIPANRVVDWSLSGNYDPIVYPALKLNILQYGGKNDSTGNNKTAFTACINQLAGRPGIIYFPAGKYRFTQGLVLPSGVVLRGDNSDKTSLIFNMTGNGANSIQSIGRADTYWVAITQSAKRGSRYIKVNDASRIAAGTWINMRRTNYWDTQPPNTYSGRSPGQIVLVKSVSGDLIELADPLLQNMSPADSSMVRTLVPVKNVVIENLKITRPNDAANTAYNMFFSLAVNCRISGVESHFSSAAHILFDMAAHNEVSGCYIHESYVYDGVGTHGYGITMVEETSFCRIENNVLKRLRHHIIFKQGSSGNVAGYNYCLDPIRVESPTNGGADLIFHGFWASANLVEGNIGMYLQFTATWGPSGPCNTIFRNRLNFYGMVGSQVDAGTNRLQSDSITCIANDVTGTGSYGGSPLGYLGFAGSDHLLYGNRVQGVLSPPAPGGVNIPEVSLYRKNIPYWWNYADPYGGIGYPNTYDCNKNPANRRWDSGGLVTFPADTSGNEICSSPLIRASGPIVFSSGGSVNLTAPFAPEAGETIIWSNGQTGNNLQVTTAGIYSARLINAARTCTSGHSNTIAVQVLAAPSVPLINNGLPVTCLTDSILLIGSMLDTSGVALIAGKSGIAGNADNSGNQAKFRSPRGMAMNVKGELFVCDAGNNCIRKIDNTGRVTTYAGSTAGLADGSLDAAKFNAPEDAAFDSKGNLYISDRGNHRIRKISVDGIVSTFAGSDNGNQDSYVPEQAKFSNQLGIETDANDVMWVADIGNTALRKILPDGQVSTVATIYGLSDIYSDPVTGNLFALSMLNNKILKINTLSGLTEVWAGNGQSGNSNEFRTDASFNNPTGISGDRLGNIYIADMGNNCIRKIDAAGMVSTLSGSRPGSSNGALTNALYNSPSYLCNLNGTFAVSDTADQTIRRIALPSPHRWSNGDTNASLTAGRPGTFILTQTNCNNLESASIPVNVSFALPAPAFTGAQIVMQGQTAQYIVLPQTGAISFAWRYTGTGATINVADRTAIIHFNANATSGYLYAAAVSACGKSKEDSMNIRVAVTGNEKLLSNYFSIKPNPSSGSFRIESFAEIKKVQIYNTLGQLVYINENHGLAHDLNLQVSTGIYIVHLQTELGEITQRISVVN
ncbi:MAG: glycosyl hydrolase family 28-related protein [Bacteroidota bacterium]